MSIYSVDSAASGALGEEPLHEDTGVQGGGAAVPRPLCPTVPKRRRSSHCFPAIKVTPPRCAPMDSTSAS